MKIELLCPKCSRALEDKFSAGNCKIMVGGSHWLDMECLNCGEILRVEIKASQQHNVEDGNNACPKGGKHEWGIDGMHSNEYCKKCFISRP